MKTNDIENAFRKFAEAVKKVYWPICIPEYVESRFVIYTRAKAEVFFLNYFSPDRARWITKRIPRKLLSLWL